MSSTQGFTCVFCNEVFENKEILQEHFRKHGDPKFNSGSKNKSRPQSDHNVGEKAEDGEMVGCDVCDESFPSISKAITHKHKIHPNHDAKYFCPWCGKLFTMKHLYNKHMQSNHTDKVNADYEGNYHCDCCEVDFFDPSAIMYHNKFFHRQDTELPSIGHSKKVKKVNQTLIQIYYCPFCGEEYNNKVNLHKHMADDHSDENHTPDEILRCPLCDAVFYHLDAYELHLSFHTTDDVYNDESETLLAVTDFSLESVPPLMEFVEEETKDTETQGIDKFLQLIMDESRESGNTDGNDKPKSKKHKKHKKSKKAAITLDEFLNMNKDVFGDGLDVQGIEEVPTQQVLKKCKGKNVAKPLSASALAKLKKQGITVKSNSSGKSPIPKINKKLIVNKAKILPNDIPVKVQEKPTTVTTSNEMLSKLLNQGNSQIKIVKRFAEEPPTKNTTFDEQDQEELTIQQMMQNKLSNPCDTEDATESKENEMDHDKDDLNSKSEAIDQEVTNNNENNVVCAENSKNVLQECANTTINNEVNAHYNNDNDTETLDQNADNLSPELSNIECSADLQTPEKDDDTKEEASDEDMPDDTETITGSLVKECSQQECLNKTTSKNTLDALKRLRGVITVKTAQSAEDKSDITDGGGHLSRQNDATDRTENVISNVSKALGKNVQNVVLKKPTAPQIKSGNSKLATSINKLKNLNNQLSIKSMSPVSSVSKSNEEIDDNEFDNESDSELAEDVPDKNPVKEGDNAIFKTPITTIKQTTAKSNHILDTKKPIQLKAPTKESVKEEDDTKKSFNMDILKRLSNVTAKPVVRAQNNIQTVQNANSPRLSKQKVEKNKIDQDIEIFNIDDSDDDQETPNDEPVPKFSANVSKNNEAKSTVFADVLKNLSKNVTVKLPSPSSKNSSNIKNDNQGEKSSPSLDKNIQNPTSNNKINIQKKQMNMNLSQTLKKLGNNISIKSQYSSPDPDRYQMLQDEDDDNDMDDHFNDDESDSETTSKVKISEVQDDEELPSDTDMEYNENVIIQSPHESYSENEEEHHSNHSDEETNEDFEKQIKMSTVSKEKAASNACLINFKRNNKELTIKSLNEKNTDFSQVGSPVNTRVAKNPIDTVVNQNCGSEKQNDSEVSTKKVTQAAASSSNQKVTNQVNTVKTVKTFQSETVIEEITTTVTKTIRTVNQSSKLIAQNKVANINTFRPRLAAPNNQVRPIQGMTVRNAQTVGTKVRQSAPSPRPTIAVPSRPAGQLVPVRPQNQIVQRPGIMRPNAPGPSNIRKISPQTSAQKPVIGLKIVRTSVKQATQVETRSDNIRGTAKRTTTTLDAIERLQKQGLLIKKPRVEIPEENEQYNSESDNDYDCQ